MHMVLFTAAISGFAAVASVIYDWTMLPAEGFERNLGWRMLFAASLGFGVAVVVSQKMLQEFRLKASLEYALTYDALTGTYSRRAIFERLERMKDRGGILVIADIDHFKSINDTWGHAAGDDVLRHFGTSAREYLASGDGGDAAAIGRVGGEEFVIHLDGIGLGGMADWIDGLRAAIRAGPVIDGAGEDGVQVTASYGVTVLDGRPLDLALSEADTALYQAKQTGRDRACVAQHLALPPGAAVAVPAHG